MIKVGAKVIPTKEELSSIIKSNYNIEVIDIKPVRSVLKIITNNGDKGLIKGSKDKKINFLTSALNHTDKNGFKKFAHFAKNKKGRYTFQIGNNNYALIDWIPGREIDMDHLNELEEAARTYGQYHQAAKGFKIPKYTKYDNNLGAWPNNLKSHYAMLLDFKKSLTVRKDLTSFDALFLKTVDPVLEWCETAISLLNKSAYKQLVKVNQSKPCLIHHSCYAQNLIYTPNGEVFLIDWGRSMIDLPIHDVANLMTRHLRHKKWDINRAQIILDGYTSVKKISSDEMELLKLLISFPQKYFVTAKKYYTKNENKEELLLGKLERLEKEDSLKAHFLRHFDSLKV